MITETSIRYFLALAEHLNYTSAAKALKVSQQNVSKAISKLEKDMDTVLFVRTHHYVYLTDAGERFAALFQRFSEEYSAAQKLCKQESCQAPVLHVGILEDMDLSSGIQEAARTCGRRIACSQYGPQELAAQFDAHKLDIIITSQHYTPEDRQVQTRRLLETQAVILSAAGHRVTGNIRTALSQETLITTSQDSEKSGRVAKPGRLRVMPNLDSARLAVQMDQGVMLSTQLSPLVADARFQVHPLELTRQVLCYYHKSPKLPDMEDFSRAVACCGQPQAAAAV